MQPYLRTAPVWEKSIYYGSIISSLTLLTLYWKIYFSTHFIVASIIFSFIASVWLARRTWEHIRLNDPRDKKRTWISPTVRKKVLQKEFFISYSGTVIIAWFFVLLFGAATVAFRPVESRTFTNIHIENCTHHCASCKKYIYVNLFEGFPKILCADDLAPSMPPHTLFVKGRFTSYAGFVTEIHQ